EGERSMGKGQLEAAAKAFRRAVDSSGANAALRASAAGSLFLALEESGQNEPCARAFVELGPSLSGAKLASGAFIASACLGAGGSAPWVADVQPAFEKLLDKAKGVSEVPLDQQIGNLFTLSGMREARGD